jgi:hypothetical protein
MLSLKGNLAFCLSVFFPFLPFTGPKRPTEEGPGASKYISSGQQQATLGGLQGPVPTVPAPQGVAPRT